MGEFFTAMILFRAAWAFAAIVSVFCEKPSDVRFHTVTWNVDEDVPPKDLDEFLGLDKKQSPDLIAVSVQGLGQSQQPNAWSENITSTVTPKGYFKVNTSTKGTVSLFIYAHEKYKDELNTTSVKTTEVDYNDQKRSGVFTSFQWFLKRFLFIGSRFSGKVDNLENRYSQYHKVWFSVDADADYIFWLGALNFKVDRTPEEAKMLIDQGNIGQLLEHDQLKKAQKEKKAFEEWSEPDIKFKPNYKFKIGTDEYNLTKTPSWTDRILYFSDTRKKIEPVKYTSLDKYNQAKRRPVMAEFLVHMWHLFL